jgi:hypothetical protein
MAVVISFEAFVVCERCLCLVKMVVVELLIAAALVIFLL